MARIHYVIGDATYPKGKGTKFIVHICNDQGRWGSGFVLEISKRWDRPRKDYQNWYDHIPKSLPLGQVQLVRVTPKILVANLIGQRGTRDHGNIWWRRAPPPIRYAAVKEGLGRVRDYCKYQAWQDDSLSTVHMPRIGCGLAGGKWERIEPLIQSELVSHGIEVFVYDLPKGNAS